MHENLGKISKYLRKIHEEMAPNVWRKTNEDLFWKSHQKTSSMIAVGENM